jgi:WD40 repeat protein
MSLSVDRSQGSIAELEVTYWDIKTGRPINAAVLDPEFRFWANNRFWLSASGERLYLVSWLSSDVRHHMPAELQWPGSITCWELPGGDKKFVIRDDSVPRIQRMSSVTFEGDMITKLAAICKSQTICVWDAVSGEELHRFDQVDALHLALKSDVLAAATRSKVLIWNLRTDEEQHPIEVPLLQSGRAGIYLNFDGRQMAVMNETKRIIEIWDLTQRKRLHGMELDAEIDSGIADVAFSPDGTLLAVVGREFTGEPYGWRTYDGHLYVWDVAHGQLVRHSTFNGGRGSHRLVFSRDGRRLMVVSQQDVHLCHFDAAKP